MRLSEINKLKEKYILDESIKELYFGMVNQAEYLLDRVNNERSKIVVEKEIKLFIEEYIDILPIIRTILAFDKYARRTDPDRPSIVGISKLLNSTREETLHELEKFKRNIIDDNAKIKATYENFKRMYEKMSETDTDGYVGSAILHGIMDLNNDVKNQLGDFYKANTLTTTDNTTLTSHAEEMLEANYILSDELNEAVSEPDQYYIIAEFSLYDSKKSDKVPHKNFKNVFVAHANTQAQARQKLKSSVNKSLKELNKTLKDQGFYCKAKKDSWFKDTSVYKGYDSIKNKNIKSLSGSDAVSTGVYLLGGMTGHGTVNKIPEYAPNSYAMHSSKSSVTRYINKHYPKEK